MHCPACFEIGNDPHSCEFCGYRGDQSREGVYLPIGTLLHNGEYIIGKVLGRPGGFGITYLAWDTRFDIKVAIKEYLPFQIAARAADGTSVSIHTQDYRADFEFGLDKFLEEAKTLAQFRHPNIVRVLNFFRENGTAYMVMDYLEGESLAEYLARVGTLTVPDAEAIIRPLLDGLSHIHAKNILHRDIKPANIYLTREGQAILLDFGSARQSFRNLSKSLTAVVTPGFAPWEQYHRKGKQGPWTDIYACAATLYFMVTGIVPPDGTERLVEDDLVAIGDIVPEADGKVMDAIMKGLAVNPENRQQTVVEMVGDLEVAAYGGGALRTQFHDGQFDTPLENNSSPLQPVNEQDESRRSVEDKSAQGRGDDYDANVLLVQANIPEPTKEAHNDEVHQTGTRIQEGFDGDRELKSRTSTQGMRSPKSGTKANETLFLRRQWERLDKKMRLSVVGVVLVVLAIVGGAMVFLMDEQQVVLSGHSSPVTSVVFNAEGTTLASGSEDGVIKLWDMTKSYTNTRTIVTEPNKEIKTLAFSPDGKTLISGGHDGVIRIFDLSTGKELRAMLGHPIGGVYSIAVSSDSKHLASGGLDDIVKVWDYHTGREMKKTNIKGIPRNLHFSPDGQELIIARDDVVKRMRIDQIGSAEVSPSLSSTTDKSVVSQDKKLIAHVENVWQYSQPRSHRENRIVIREFARGVKNQTMERDPGIVQSMAFNPSGRVLASTSLGRRVDLWDVNSGKSISHDLFTNTDINVIAINAKSAMAGGGENGDVYIWKHPQLK